MLNLKDAIAIAKRYIADLSSTNDIQCSLFETPAETGDFCFVFSYQSSKYFETLDFKDGLIGNSPIIIDRTNGDCIVTGTANPAKYYLENYEERGDPFKEKSAVVELFGCNDDPQKVSATKAIRTFTDLGLKDSKKAIDDCLEGNSSQLEAIDEIAADELVKELRKLNFSAKQI